MHIDFLLFIIWKDNSNKNFSEGGLHVKSLHSFGFQVTGQAYWQLVLDTFEIITKIFLGVLRWWLCALTWFYNKLITVPESSYFFSSFILTEFLWVVTWWDGAFHCSQINSSKVNWNLQGLRTNYSSYKGCIAICWDIQVTATHNKIISYSQLPN